MNSSIIKLPSLDYDFETLFPTFSRLNLLLTPRGTVLLIFLFYFLLGPVFYNSDIVAAVVSFSLFAILILIVVFSAFYGNYLTKKIELSIQAPTYSDEASGKRLTSQRSELFTLHLSKFSLLPFFMLQIKLEFEQENLILPVHKLLGIANEDRMLPFTVNFPHRGLWNLKQARCSFSDQFGLTRYNWRIDLNMPCRVNPDIARHESLPVLSSCFRPGDSMFAQNQRVGDPLDLKQYHPSDGMKKVVWKIFARSGNLVARHPEQSVTPEGQLVIYCIAAQDHDAVCAVLLAYLQRLEEMDLEVFCGCLGMQDSPPARSWQTALELFVNNAWINNNTLIYQDNFTKMEREIHNLTQVVKQQGNEIEIDSLIIFIAAESLASTEAVDLYCKIGDSLESQNIKPIFCVIIWGQLSHKPSTAISKDINNYYFYNNLNSWFLGNVNTPTKPVDQSLKMQAFLNRCLSKNWQVYEQNYYAT